jgi:hypothetical protein
MIDIRPDPKHPRGGFAEITVQGVAPSEAPLEIAVFNAYQQKWLGADGWQAMRVGFPVRAQVWAGETLKVIIGPDVVNQIDDDTPLKIALGGQEWDTYWPDDINRGPDEALEGGISGAAAAAAPTGPKKVTTMPKPAPIPAPLPGPVSGTEGGLITDPIPEPGSDTDEEETEGAGGSKLPLILGGLAVLAAIAAAVWFFVLAPDTEPDPVPVPVPVPVPAPVPVPDANACTTDALGALAGQGFAALAEQLGSCGGAVSADDALGFVERAAQAGDGDALALFGALYDSGVTVPGIEDQMGLTFSDQPGLAAGYYAQARDAGSELGTARLGAICLRLALETGTLATSAREDYCQ